MIWMFVWFNAMLLIYLLKTWFLIRKDLVNWGGDKKKKGRRLYRCLALGRTSYDESTRKQDNLWVHRLAWISLPVGLLFYGTNGAFFAIITNRPVWNSALTPFFFIVAALLSGGALITFLSHIYFESNPSIGKHPEHEQSPITYLGRIILFLLITFLFLEMMQFFVGYVTGKTDMVASLNRTIAGPGWWTFWVIHLLIGALIPLVLLLTNPKSPKSVAWACFLIFITFIGARYNYIISDLAVSKLDGLEDAFVHSRLSTNYVPNLNEWLVSLWVVSFGLLTFLLGARFLPVINNRKGVAGHE